MATEVSICSNALMRLGAEPINSFDEADNTGSNIERARLASNLWPTVRKAVLRGHPWNCATKRVLLSADATPPEFGYANRFLFPSDWLRTLQVGEDSRDLPDFRTESAYFLSDEASLYLVYVFDNEVPNTYDTLLVQALELGMAAAMAYAVTKSSSLRDSLNDEFRVLLQQARSTDGQDDPPETLGDFPLYSSRFS